MNYYLTKENINSAVPEDIRIDERTGDTMKGYAVSDKHCILINGAGRFIIAERFDNCISIGNTHVHQYDTLSEALEAYESGERPTFV